MRIFKMALFVALTTNALSQESFQDTIEIHAFTDKTMNYLISEEYEPLFKELDISLDLKKEDFQTFRNSMLVQLKLAENKYGKILNHVHVKDYQLTNVGYKCYYILKFEKNMLKIVYSFYKAEENWALISFSWDDHISELYE